jgi:threonine dehydratase
MPDLSALARQAAAKTRAVSGRVHDHTVVTPLIGWAAAREECGTEILLKCEHQQKTGSFKVRGALAKVLSLGEAQRDRGVVAASSGNHGGSRRAAAGMLPQSTTGRSQRRNDSPVFGGVPALAVSVLLLCR